MLKTEINHLFWIAVFSLMMSFCCIFLIAPLDVAETQTLITDQQLSVKGNDSTNPGARLRHDLRGKLFIKPGRSRSIAVTYTSSQDTNLRLELRSRRFVQECSESGGSLDVNVYKNNELIYSSNQILGQNNEVYIDAKRGDSVSIELGKNQYHCTWLVASFTNEDLNLSVRKIALVFLLAIFIGYCTCQKAMSLVLKFCLVFSLFMVAEKETFGTIQYSSVLTYLALSMFVISLALLLSRLCALGSYSFKWLAIFLNIAVSILVCITPAVFIIYTKDFNHALDQDSLFAIFQTNFSEAAEFVDGFISVSSLILLLLGLAIIVVVTLILYRHVNNRMGHWDVLLFSCLIVFSGYQIHNDADTLRIFSFTEGSWSKYQAELVKFQLILEKRNAGKIKYDAYKENNNETYIVVVGESVNKAHLGLYGYVRETTPRLSQYLLNGSLMVFENAFSSHTHTMPTLSLALTQANQHNGKEYFNVPSVLDLLDSAGVRTAWVTNQVVYGDWDNLVSVLAAGADERHNLNKNIGTSTRTTSFDADVIPVVSEILGRGEAENRIIFVHLMGSHGKYCNRFPIEYKVYNGELDVGDFGNAAKQENLANRLNCYDNSILYSDYVVSELIEELRAIEGVSGLVYFSDHSEDVLRGLGHNAAQFTMEMTQIPLFVWLSEDYQQLYPEKIRVLKGNAYQLFSNDLIYETLLGITGIKTPYYEEKHDLSNEKYALPPESSLTLHGQRLYSNSAEYRKFESVAGLKKLEQLSRVIPHRVNTLGKLGQIIHSGFRAFELDVIFREGHFFEVGHDDSNATGQSLEGILNRLESQKYEKLWLDVKNAGEENIGQMLQVLEKLNRKFGLKEKLIFESSSQSFYMKEISDAGFHTSYYLPTQHIKNLLENGDGYDLALQAKAFAEQANTQSLSAVSFDSDLYPFVDKYLGPILDEEVVFHTWNLRLRLNDQHFLSELLSSDIYKDERIKTILINYKTAFNF
ncbi:MAG: hypothetical protein C9356_12660 [Oleiphilus sp.]|nr:MAG: hypothetical protein C9356_12660 [Oleiphilus sp.]